MVPNLFWCIPPFADFGTFFSSPITQFYFIPPLYYTRLQEYLICQYIVSHLTFTCHGVAYCSGSWTSITAIGPMDFIEDNNLINKSGTKLFVK